MFQDDRVHYSNQPIAVAVADTLERARHAARLVKVSYAPEEPPSVRLTAAKETREAGRPSTERSRLSRSLPTCRAAIRRRGWRRRR